MALGVANSPVEEMRGVQSKSHRDFMALPALYTPSEVADKLKVNRRSVYQWLATEQLKGLKAGQSWRITEEDLITYMRRSHRLATPEKDSGGSRAG